MDTIVKITDIIGKHPAQIEELLGRVNRVEKVSPSGTPCKETPYDKGIYQSGRYEVVFINGLADWITISQTSGYRLNEDSIELIGLPKSIPTFNNPSNILRWDGLYGIKEISFHDNGSGMIDFIYIKAITG